MTRWTVHQILEATGGRLVRGRPAGSISGIAIDSRRLVPGEAFVAIKGTRLDGHRFIEEAAHRGASCLIVSCLPTPANGSASLPTILVEETTRALGDLARYHRRRFTRPVVAVTGSCGKTTTKELIAHLLGSAEAILKTTGTQNNHIGVPLTLLRMAPHHQAAVVELGSNHPGEIAYLASIAEPDVALITNVGPVHLEFFGSVAGVLREKLSLLEALPSEGSAVLPGDQLDVCLEASRHLDPTVRRISFGTTDRCDLQALDIRRAREGMLLRLRDHGSLWAIPLVGYHNVENALAALACVWALGVPLSEARDRLGSFQPLPLRSQVVRCNGLTILNDCYNANPLSFARALETLKDMDVRRKVAIVGDMLELGSYAPSAHQAIGRLATQLGIDAVIAVGQYADAVAQGVQQSEAGGGVATYRTVPELLQALPDTLREGDGLLIKGSRKLNLEQVTEFLIEHYRSLHGRFLQ
ncbi:MAG: UDP-N-acetylmuramoyl-tripeptide--D-alanyl-D-alanine ligase [Candidatus Omnitrophica bacterium]|nr:UDP-N-acetylmuramoyl-tripeptide--D-alanyl-D-alanine ligase [Candidatus Omnitrophota bacterium]MBI3020440.1 UDP-N-acetylmuramoyl-tripeptide--D-alanyl-D-alanine ligase [Candidatus Omnitrophota bacterium]